MFVSPHTHAESHLTGSTLKGLVARAKELGRTHFAYTDHGSLSSALKIYGMAKAKDLKPILGLEFYFKDPSCHIVQDSVANRSRYFTATIYCEDQEAYQALVALVSRTDFTTIKVSGDDQNLWLWSHLIEMAKYKTNIVLSGVHCMVSKPMLAGDAKAGDLILQRLLELFPGRVFPALLAEPWKKRFSEVIEITFTDGSKDSILASDYITTNRAKKIRALDLVERPGHAELKAKYTGGTYSVIGKEIQTVKRHKGFLPYPGGDVTLRCNKFLKALAAKYSLPVLVTDYAYYAEKEDRVVQDMKLEGANKLQSSLHMKEDGEITHYLASHMNMGESEICQVLRHNEIWADRFKDFSLKYDWRLAETGPEPLKQAMEIIKRNGRMKWDDPMYVDRLKEELEVIAKNGKKDLTPYFLPINGVLDHYLDNGQLTGPGRGSAAGSLFAYLMGITHVNPFKYDLSFNRFYSMDRILSNKLADIDSDLEDRELLVGADGKSGYLYTKYGNKAAQIGTRQTLRLKSTIKDTNRYFFEKVEPEIEALTSGLPDAPQGVSDDNFLYGYEDDDGNHVPGLLENSEKLQEYAKKRPKEWNIVLKGLGVTRAFSSHASAFVIADVPVSSLVPTRDGNITQYEAKEAEAAGLIKYDLLVVSQLKDIRVCIDLINKRNNQKHKTGYFEHNGQLTYVWDLPHDLDVFKSVWNGSTETCFQINTKSMIPFVKAILPQIIEDVATILALVRPGPLDYVDQRTGRNMAEEYVHRRAGGSYEDIAVLNDLIPETLSVLVYQEQITKIAKEVAGFNGSEAEQLRENIGKKKKEALMATKPRFIEGCVAKGRVTEAEAEELWARIETAGRYSFNKSHAVSYAFISYACMFFKYRYPLEWWASVLSNADEKEITSVLWPYVKDKVLPPDINLSTDQMVVDYAKQKIRSKIGVIRGMGDATIGPIVENRPYKDIQDFVDKEVAGNALTRKLIHVGVLDSLFPANKSFLEKLKLFEDAVEIRDFRIKKEEAEKSGKKIRQLQPKEGVVPDEYVGLHPLKDAAMRKAVLPSLPIDFYDLGRQYSKLLIPMTDRPHLLNKKNMKTVLLTGEHLRRFDELPENVIRDDVYFSVMAYVIEAKEFNYPKANPTKRALKLIIDTDSYVSEKVLWPDYQTGQLIYPPELKKGRIISLFLKKRVGKKDVQITEIFIEA